MTLLGRAINERLQEKDRENNKMDINDLKEEIGVLSLGIDQDGDPVSVGDDPELLDAIMTLVETYKPDDTKAKLDELQHLEWSMQIANTDGIFSPVKYLEIRRKELSIPKPPTNGELVKGQK